MESEYIALSDAAKEAIFLRKLLASLTIKLSPTILYTDSESALDHVKNNVKHPRTKHIDTRHHYIRSVYGSQINIRHVPAASQTADILTKPLATVKHTEAVRLLRIMVLPPSSSTSSRWNALFLLFDGLYGLSWSFWFMDFWISTLWFLK